MIQIFICNFAVEFEKPVYNKVVSIHQDVSIRETIPPYFQWTELETNTVYNIYVYEE